MNSTKMLKPNILQAMVLGTSLFELLQSLKIVCENLNLEKMNYRSRHFKDLRLLFFGLMVKANGLSERLIYQADFLQQNNKKFAELYSELNNTKSQLSNAYKRIQNNNISETAKQLITIAKEYKKTYQKICLLSKYIL